MKTTIVTRWVAAAAVAVASLVAVPAAPAMATPAGDNLVINEVYNNGGSAGASYAHRFFELYNPTDHDISVNGWSLQYKSATGATFSGKTELGDKHLEPGGTLVVRGASNNAATNPGAPVTADIAPDTGLNSAAGSGVIALSRSTATLTTSLTDANLVDLVGYGTTANLFEGSARAATGGLALSVTRRTAGADSDDNGADFAAVAPSPAACGTTCDGPGDSGGGPVDPPADPVDATIAEIQGAGAASPLAGKTVTTRGVVTAVYKTGGFNGAVIQTPGTGGAVDAATHTTSDGLFVFDSAFAAGVDKGDFVEVTGDVSEFNGLTELTTAAGKFTKLTETPAPVLPATISFPLSEVQRESFESMLLLPQGAMTVTDNYATNQYGEIGLADGSEPLQTPTNVVAPGAPAKALLAENTQRLVNLDDGSSVNFLSAANQGIALPWLRPDNEVRVGAAVSFVDPVVLDWRNSVWKLQPTQHLTSSGKEPVTFSSTRTAGPTDVGGDVRIGTFNVLNYFSTTAADFEKSGLGTCTTYKDRAGNPVTANSCTNNGPRGAADDANLERQQAKIVAAINTLDADVVSLEEIENSKAVDPKADRDEALATLVDALNGAAGKQRWAFVASPATVPAAEDVIRTAFIYQPKIVAPVGASSILDDPAFTNARQPLAQAFKRAGGPDTTTFAVIVNHFKSKGSGTGLDADQGDGQGASNHSRVQQATALVGFADRFGTSAGTDKIFLTGDFNAYNKEDPVRIIEEAGYTNVPAERTTKETYQFDGMVGSLDHVFASPAAYARVTGADIWNINAYEALAREYSRYNYNATDLYRADPYRASDHDPELVGVDLGAELDATTTSATAPASIRAGADLTVSVSVSGRATGDVTVTEGGTVLGRATLVDGAAEVVIAGLPIGSHLLTVTYSGDATHQGSSTTVATRVVKALSGLTASAGPATYGTSAALTVTGAPGASGLVYVASGDQLAGMGMMTGGTATITLSSRLPVGTSQLTVFYAGSAGFDPATTTTSVTVAKASTTLKKVSVSPSRIVVKRTKAFVTLSVKATGFTVDGGKVTLRQGGKNYSGTVRNGKVRIRLAKFTSKGSAKKVTATYSGNSVAKGSKTSFTVKVRAK
ncbi:ExeM/NucH family extracellular endonuclease [Aeromicrobium wangtongii]|uniref:ExeM/NucH family extracellular endonuclease n=1 Tax=Aeromicrobium wangtongii TaxID=2969247 RepID=A0ABY5M7H4_9ACTN|nr:ExeM/NucH family extracellular endonuclease [Aeromicrobium wangtongii]MCD9198933.1 ExeM/NucH family extracellular endonuclease [Aeromicrobium wangtongii]UUP13029.1 ExeM/NucH family extracellular endonuclease [Aeromicrobium wangtongii]